MFREGQKLRSTAALRGGAPNMENCVRGKVVQQMGDLVLLRDVQIYLPGTGWYPSNPIDEHLEVDSSTVDLVPTNFDV